MGYVYYRRGAVAVGGSSALNLDFAKKEAQRAATRILFWGSRMRGVWHMVAKTLQKEETPCRSLSFLPFSPSSSLSLSTLVLRPGDSCLAICQCR